MLNRNAWTNVLEARLVIGDVKHEHNTRYRHSALGTERTDYRGRDTDPTRSFTIASSAQPGPLPGPSERQDRLGHELLEGRGVALGRVQNEPRTFEASHVAVFAEVICQDR